MRKFIIMVGFGFGLATGGGLVYLLTTNTIALMVFFGMTMFVLGCVVVGVVLLVNNRQWIRAMGGGQQQRVNYNLRMPAMPFAQPYQQLPAGMPPATMASSQWPMSGQDFDFPPMEQLPAGGPDEPKAFA